MYSFTPATPTTQQREAIHAIVDQLWEHPANLLRQLAPDADPTPTFFIQTTEGLAGYSLPFTDSTKFLFMEHMRDQIEASESPVHYAALMYAAYLRPMFKMGEPLPSDDVKREGIILHVETVESIAATASAHVHRHPGAPATLDAPTITVADAGTQMSGGLVCFFRKNGSVLRVQ